MPAQPRARAFLSLLHHILENKDFISDFDTAPSEKRMLDPPIRLDRDPAPGMPKENVDPPEELEFARQMKELRDGVVKTVPAIQKKEEEARERLRKETEREQAVRTGESSHGMSVTVLHRLEADPLPYVRRLCRRTGKSGEAVCNGWQSTAANVCCSDSAQARDAWSCSRCADFETAVPFDISLLTAQILARRDPPS